MSILIAEHIKQVLDEDEAVRRLCGDRIYPVVASEGSKFPFVVFGTKGDGDDDTKDGAYDDAVHTTFACVSKSYSEAASLAEAIKRAMRNAATGEYESFTVDSTTYEGHDEDFLLDLSAYQIDVRFRFDCDTI